MKDKLFIHDLKIDAVIGIFAHERIVKQPLLIQLEIMTDIRPAAKTDNLQDALDYATIAARITTYISNSHFQLIETLAEKIAELLICEFNILQLRLQITKPNAIANAKHAGILIDRCNDDYLEKIKEKSALTDIN